MSWPECHFTLKKSAVEIFPSGFEGLNICPGQSFQQSERCNCNIPSGDLLLGHIPLSYPSGWTVGEAWCSALSRQLRSPPDFTTSPNTSPSKVSQLKDNVTARLSLSNQGNSFHTVLGPRLLSLISKDALKRKTSKERTDYFYFGISVYLWFYFKVCTYILWPILEPKSFFICFPEGYKTPQ